VGPKNKQSRIKLEEFGLAIADASKAIELDPKYIKAYYRRAVSFLAIMKYADALKDFRAVCRQGEFGGERWRVRWGADLW